MTTRLTKPVYRLIENDPEVTGDHPRQVVQGRPLTGRLSKGLVIGIVPCPGDEPMLSFRTKGCQDEVLIPALWVELQARKREAGQPKRKRNPRLRSTLKL